LNELDYWLTTPRLNLVSAQSIQFGEASIHVLGDDEATRIRAALTKRLMVPARPTDVYAPKIETFRNVTSLTLRVPGSHADYPTVREIGERYEMLIFLTEAFSLRRNVSTDLRQRGREFYEGSPALLRENGSAAG
jgi:hypothetical protein